MSLEAVMICLDNSEWMRNGDYSPTRLAAQTETINYLTEAKLRNHQDSTVGLLAMAGKRIEVHVAPCRSPGKIVKALTKEVKIGGKSDVLGALKTAQLALKNRQNKNLRQRIILFVGSPIEDDVKQFIKLGKIFKKHNVAVDVINFGEENGSNENMEKLEAFVNAVKNGDNSHFLTVPPGPHDLSDLVLTSGIMHGQAGGGFGGLNNLGDLGVIPANLGGPATGTGAGTGNTGAGAGTGGGAGTGAGAPLIGADGIPVDPNVDPETYLAIKASMEEEYQRQQKLAKEREAKKDPVPTSKTTTATASAASSSSSSSSSSAASTSSTSSSSSGETPMDTGDDEEDPDDEAEALLLQQALQMSIGADDGDASNDNKSSSSTTETPEPKTTTTESEKKVTGEEEEPDLTLALSDPNFLNSLLESVPGVNKDQISMDSILEGLTGSSSETPATPEEATTKKPKKKTGKPKKGGKKRKENPK